VGWTVGVVVGDSVGVDGATVGVAEGV